VNSPAPRLAVALVLGLSFVACPRREPPPEPVPVDAGAEVGPCLRWRSDAVRVGEVPVALGELSGLVASARHEGIFWAHNDSGNALELFALRQSGEVVARFPLVGVTAPDVEDVALGPCVADAARTCVLLGDIGDNARARAFVQLLEVEEPLELLDGPLAARAYRFRYPGGPRDAEALLVDPSTGGPHVVSKTWDHLGDLYRLDGLVEGAEVEAVHLGAFAPTRGTDRFTTGADAWPGGGRVLLRTYSRVWEVRGEPGSTLQALLGAPVVEVTSAPQPQSEAVAYVSSGRAYVLGTEGEGEGLFRVDCRD
jgi:hypothetical protein